MNVLSSNLQSVETKHVNVFGCNNLHSVGTKHVKVLGYNLQSFQLKCSLLNTNQIYIY